ncbi:MAG: ATP-binding cassette domain-containing protein [Anaerolineales bacterium]|nr:ATP-binding cassette domain-containing protein [Anaerolineales bacterium]MCX7754306.1 ATP-binding cassette domain-containing protein [Anaerolineales bacterium]MDW8278659.1 ATP-binding cassette domain-containing protein [Anaerolineales bacterium]
MTIPRSSVASTISPAASMLDIRRVVKTFKNAAGEFTVLKGVDLQVARGEFVSIVGKSGSGKSTLLNMMTGIDRPTSGQVIVNGQDLYTALDESQRSRWRGKNLGIVFQFFQLLPMLSLLENVMLPMDYAGLYDFDERPRRAMQLLEMVGLKEQSAKLPMAVSTGQQQLAAIARALACDPPLIVADEPTGNLDSRTADVVIQIFERLVAEGKTIIMVTHNPSLTARTTRNIIISDGEIVNETVARALPLLNHRQMLQVTKKVQRQSVPPGQAILRRDEHVDTFFIIERGEVEIVLQGKNRQDVTVARLSPGEYFGEVELIRGGKALAVVRAAPEAPVDLLTLPREEFLTLLEASPLTREAIGRIVQNRIEQNRSIDRRGKGWWPFR